MDGKSNVFHYLNMHRNEKILVIADGATFGSEISKVLQLIYGRKNVAIYLPESFEWLILHSGILENNVITKIVDSPYEYIESQEYFSWERFFTNLLIEKTDGTYMKYQKSKLNPVYLHEKNKRMILSSARGIL